MGELAVVSFKASTIHEELANGPDGYTQNNKQTCK
jgi:hypothetical protein